MQVILGASGQIGRELAIQLKREFTSEIRLVSRRPHKVNDTDQLQSADLLDAGQTLRAVEGAEIAYLTAQVDVHMAHAGEAAATGREEVAA
ncbi:NAD-dependent epimerase/dehydratase family protein [Myxococcus sp. MxC21-1]|uniref:NAD-dependent epimerase/dehydratase family protein n=1 Tax=Myxococcus sp. MxC21-1 TaxID=3041439 RepID=UPI002931D2F7|nr:NAD-dependent epimerase/dehydratase family protein [Myxococcus sp. MxC21-1]WNZ60878.1 NAD-dependent epimerase/dehydratase family protein [Myxococcus sp. MxC21-1]